MNIFSQLPNNLIMDIIREVDGGLNTHKTKMLETLKIIKCEYGCLGGDIQRPSMTLQEEEEEYEDDVDFWRIDEPRFYNIIDGTGWWGDGTTQFKPPPRYTPPPLP